VPFRQRLKLVLIVVLVGIAVDQVTKEVARRTLKDRGTLHFLHDTLRLQYSENEGAFLSLGAGMSEGTRFWVFTVLVAVTMIVLAVYTLGSRSAPRDHRLALAWVLSGGTSNLIDRIVNDGHVVDFLNVGLGSYRWSRTGIFNVADMAILGGCLYLLFWGGHKKAAVGAAADAEAADPDEVNPGTPSSPEASCRP